MHYETREGLWWINPRFGVLGAPIKGRNFGGVLFVNLSTNCLKFEKMTSKSTINLSKL